MWPWVTENPKQQWLEQNVFNFFSFGVQSNMVLGWVQQGSLVLETSTPSILSVHHASANDNVQKCCPVPVIISSFQPVEREERERWVYIPILPGHFWEVAFHWLECSHMATLAARRMGNVIPIPATHSGSFIEEGEVTDTEAIMLQLHILVTFQYQDLTLGKWKDQSFLSL